MSDEPATPAAPDLPDIYTPLQLLLTLLGIGNSALFSRPDDPLPRALSQLTDFGKPDIDRITAISDTAGLYELLRHDPEVFADFLLLGRLTFASPLRDSIAAYMVKDDSDPANEVATQRAGLLAYVSQHTAVQSRIFEDYLPTRYDEDDRADVEQERASLRAAIEAAFADWQHTLGALLLDAPEPVLPFDEHERGWSIRPQQPHLHALRLAVTIFQVLPGLAPSGFGDAVQRLPDFHPQRLEELHQYLQNAGADQQLTLSRTQGMLLYIAAHLTLLALLSDVLGGQGLDDLLLSRREQEGITLEMISVMREGTTIMLSAYIDLVRENEADTDDFADLEARLEPVLALGAA